MVNTTCLVHSVNPPGLSGLWGGARTGVGRVEDGVISERVDARVELDDAV
jgi:hypothetical protein